MSPLVLPTTRRRFLQWTGLVGGLVISGCARSTAEGPPPRLKLLQTQLPFAPVQAALAAEQGAAAKESGVSLETQEQAGDAVRSTLSPLVAAHQLPDLLLVGTADFGVLSAKGLLADVRASLDRVVGLNGDLFPPVAALSMGASLIATSSPALSSSSTPSASPTNDSSAQPTPTGLPLLSVGWGWLARQDLLARKNLAPPKTFDDWRNAATRLGDPGAGVAGFGARLPLGDDTTRLAQLGLLDYGAPLFGGDGLAIDFDSTAGASALGAVAALFASNGGAPIAPPGVADWTIGALEAAFARGQVALTVDFGGSYGRLVQADPALADHLAVLPPPAGPKGWNTAADVLFYAVPRRASVEAALGLVERILQPARLERLTSAGAGSVVPPYAYLTKVPFWDADPNYRALLVNTRGDPIRSLAYANPGAPGPFTGPVALVWQQQLLGAALRSVVLGQQTPPAATTILRDQAARLVPVALDQEPRPTATPEPDWLRWMRGL